MNFKTLALVALLLTSPPVLAGESPVDWTTVEITALNVHLAWEQITIYSNQISMAIKARNLAEAGRLTRLMYALSEKIGIYTAGHVIEKGSLMIFVLPPNILGGNQVPTTTGIWSGYDGSGGTAGGCQNGGDPNDNDPYGSSDPDPDPDPSSDPDPDPDPDPGASDPGGGLNSCVPDVWAWTMTGPVTMLGTWEGGDWTERAMYVDGALSSVCVDGEPPASCEGFEIGTVVSPMPTLMLADEYGVVVNPAL